jgi:RHS repeat-associated protein
VQELTGVGGVNNDPANVKASYISGGIDEVFAQLSGTGASATILTYLTDALGSTIRLADATGTKVVDYTYDPYGNTTADAAVSNPFQYTGRENDGTGLYYYRARYYSPMLARFISSDPIGLGGGINMYAYVGGNPLSRSDPLGLRPLSNCEKLLIGPYFPDKDLGDIDIQEGIPFLARKFGAEGADAWTLGNTIYMAPGIDKPDTIGGISLISHEVVHSTQYDQYGIFGLASRYKAANDANLKAGMSPYNAYRNNPFEVAGWDMGERVKNDLTSKPKGMSCECFR